MLIVLIAAELVGRVRIKWPVAVAVVLGLGLAALGNFAYLRDVGRPYLAQTSGIVLGELTALESVEDDVSPDFVPDALRIPQISSAQAYFAAVRRYGSPTAGPETLPNRPEPDRLAADDCSCERWT